MELVTQDELRRLHDTLRRRGPADPTANVLAVGFGQARCDFERDPDRPFAACYYVRRKLRRVPADRAIPDEIRVRVRRGDGYVTVTVPTDVVEAPRFAPSGMFVSHAGGVRIGSAGALVAWKRPGDNWKWGFVTAGHLFRNTGPDVAVEILGGGAVPATVLHRAGAGELLDAAILEVNRALLVAAGVPLPPGNPPVGDFWPRATLAVAVVQAEEAGAALPGASLRPEGDAPDFRSGHYFPESEDLIPDLGNLLDIVLVTAADDTLVPAAFIPGTSGSAWSVAGRPAAVQVGHDLDTSVQGLGQSLDLQLAWANTRLLGDGPLDFFRFVRAF